MCRMCIQRNREIHDVIMFDALCKDSYDQTIETAQENDIQQVMR